jgi:hypothetical protein
VTSKPTRRSLRDHRVSEIAALDGLLQIALDPQKTYSVHNLTLQAPD